MLPDLDPDICNLFPILIQLSLTLSLINESGLFFEYFDK